MAVSGFHYRSGPWDLGDVVTTASTAIAVADGIKVNSGQAVVWLTNIKCDGVALGSKAVGDTATTKIRCVNVHNGRTKFLAEAKSGTLVATEDRSFLDGVTTTSAQGIAANTTTNSDLFVYKVLSTGASGQGLINFADPSHFNNTGAA